MADEKTCPHCGKPVPPTTLGGICPECMLKAGLATQTEGPGGTGPHGTKVIHPPPSLAEIAVLFPQLEILECLGRGGMGVVYKARQPRLNRLVALKILAREKEQDAQFAERFTREAQALARLNHPNIVTVYDFGTVGQASRLSPSEKEQAKSETGVTPILHYLLMEFVDGLNLRQLLQAGKMKPEQALTIVPKICEALQYAHEQGIVHRDIKPENILLDKSGRVKIADFGIAKMMGDETGQQTLTGAKEAVGTPHYMAPEQIEKPLTVDHRADIYSLGVVFYEMLTGELPLGKFQPPSKKVQIDVRLDEVVLHALEKEPERRYQQASQVKTAVETISAASPGGPANPNESVQTAAQIEAARKRLKTPARGLIAAAVFQLLFALGLLIFTVPALARENNSLVAYAVIGFTAVGFLIPTAVVLAGAINMLNLRRYTLTVVASVIAAVAGPGAILGLPFGIWACVELFRPEVRAAFAAIRPPTGSETTPDSAKMDYARCQVKGPAVGLVVTGVLNWVVFTLFLIVSQLEHAGSMAPAPVVYSPVALLLVCLLAMALSGFIIYGALRIMRLERWSAGIAGGILAMIVAPANIIGLPIGIWTLVALNRRAVREAFTANGFHPKPMDARAGIMGSPRFSLSSAIGAAWIPFFLAAILSITFGQDQFPQAYGSLPRVLLFLGLAAPVATTILGWLAVAQIRRSEGRLRGLEVAVFDGLLFSLLGLDVLIGIFWLVLAKTTANWRGLNGSLFVNLWEFAFWALLLIVTCAAVNFLIVRRIWRRVSQPLTGANTPIQTRWTRTILPALTCGILTLGAISFTTASLVLCARNVDNVDRPFVDDPQVIGQWASADFVSTPEDFKPGAQTWKGDLQVFQKFTVYPGGRTSYPWLVWTKGVFINQAEKTAARYEIRNFDGTHYLFVEWKNGDYILFHSKPRLFVLRQTGGANPSFYIGQTNFPYGDSIEITSVERTENQMTVKGHYNLASHDNASLALYITTSTNINVPEDASQWMEISKGPGDFELVHSNLVSGMPHVSMYADGKSFASLYLGTKAEAMKESKLHLHGERPEAYWLYLQEKFQEGQLAMQGLQKNNDAAFTFGPVRELTLNVNHNGLSDGLNLDSGSVVPLASAETDSETGFLGSRLPKNMAGIAILLQTAQHPLQYPLMVIGRAADFAPCPEQNKSREWYEEPPLELLKSYAAINLDYISGEISSTPGFGFGDLPKTFTFATGQGNVGLLQIIGFTDNSRGVKIRYKLVQANAPSVAIDPTTGLPTVAGRTIIDPNTGLPLSVAATNTVIDPTTGLPMSPGETGTIDPITGLPVTPAVPKGATNTVVVAEKWLALIDRGNYLESWKAAAPIFQGAVTEAAWANSMNTFREPLGDLVSRKLKSAQRMTELPGAPDGQYVVMQFETSFADKKSAIETVTFMLEKDGQWKCAGYFIK
ncbi:MAG: DUF4019 domain-containing protein [Verrucomicrobiota bacterium]|jgi:predicted Ser/Thr protein kinase